MNSDQITIDEIKKIALEGLDYLDKYCEEHNLRYYIAFGTLIGAIRHNGFIPWDEDIDILMPRDDYEKLIAAKDINSENWEMLSYKYTDGYFFPWAKLCHKKTELLPSRFNSGLTYGVAIDISALDYVDASNINECRDIFNKARNIYDSAVSVVKPYGVKKTGALNAIKRLVKKVYYEVYGKRKLNLSKEYQKMEKYITGQNSSNAKYAVCVHDRYKSIWNRADFDDSTITRHIFEKKEYHIPKNADGVLKASYKDYMKLPPVEEQIPIHYYTARYKN